VVVVVVDAGGGNENNALLRLTAWFDQTAGVGIIDLIVFDVTTHYDLV
jgi:hypothetical protein